VIEKTAVLKFEPVCSTQFSNFIARATRCSACTTLCAVLCVD